MSNIKQNIKNKSLVSIKEISSEINHSKQPLKLTQIDSDLERLKFNLNPKKTQPFKMNLFNKLILKPNPMTLSSKFNDEKSNELNPQSQLRKKIAENQEFRRLTIRDKIDDSGSSESENDKDNCSIVILPQSMFKELWDLFVAMLLIYTSLVTPYRISFIDDAISANPIYDNLDIAIDVIFAIDMIMSFFSAYINSEDKLEKKLNKIALNYLEGWFLIDFISVFPINIIIDNSGYNSGTSSRMYNALSRFAKIPKLYRLFKLVKLFRIVKVVKTRNMSKITRKVFDKFKVNMHLEHLIYYLLGLFLFIHISGCIFFFIAKLEDFSPDSWVTRLGYIDADPFQQYIISFYWSLTTVTTVSYGDVCSCSLPERIYNLFIMSFGVVMYSFSISFISSLVSMIDRKSSEMNAKMQALTEIKQEYNIDDEIYEKVRKLIKYDVTKSHKERSAFLLELPIKYRIELSRIIQDNVLKKVIFFQNNQDLIDFVIPVLKQIKYSQNELLLKIEETPEEMYFIIKGTVSYHLSDKYNNAEIYEIKKHHNFCEIEMCLGEKLFHSIKIKTRIGEFFILRKNDFLKLSVNFHEIIQKFLNSSLLKYLKVNDEKKKAIIKFEKEHRENCHFLNGNDKQISEDNLWQINESSEEVSENASSQSSNDNKTILSSPKSISGDVIRKQNERNNNSITLNGVRLKKHKSLFNKKENKDNHCYSAIKKLNSNKKPEVLSDLNTSLYLSEMKEKVDGCQKIMNKTIGDNIDKMIKILTNNKQQIANKNYFPSINPIKLLNKLKNATNPEQRNELLNQLEELIKDE